MYKRSLSCMLFYLLCSVAHALGQQQQNVYQGNDVTPKMQTLYRGLADIIAQHHYAPPAFDDKFSEKIYENYLIKLDPNKNIFLQKDIDELNAFRFRVDDELKGQAEPLKFFLTAQQIYAKRLNALARMPLLTDGNWKPGFQGIVIPTPDSLDWCVNTQIQVQRWNKQLSYEYFVKEADLEKGYKSREELGQRVKYALRNKYNHWFNSRLQPKDPYRSFSEYINVIAFILDPHSEYQAPVNKEKYDQQMSNMFFGVGMTLGTTEKGEIKVVSVMNGMPVWKSKKIHSDDLILALAEGLNGHWEDTEGLEIPELIEKIRGKAGSVIKLRVKDSKTSLISDVALTREKVDVLESGARSGIMIDGKSRKIGVLYLPEFYNDYAHWDGAKSANDVARELKLLQKENIDALIFDLRYNGGGSLDDVVKICGYFIKYGPVVQIKDHKGELKILSDEDGATLYEGPMAILVNGYSASASEIFAAAMQDYKRAVIMGTDTYGKGTVQHQLPLGSLDKQGEPEYGAFKLTMEKFFRINGSTTQLIGVHPDISLPDLSTYIHVREKDNFSALPADSIGGLHYRAFTTKKLIEGEFLVTDKAEFHQRLNRMDSLSRLLNSKSGQKIGLGQAKANNAIKQRAMNEFLDLESVSSKGWKTMGVGEFSDTDWYKSWLKKVVTNIWIQSAAQELTIP